MQWSPRQARYTLLLFLLILAAGQVKAYLTKPVYPDPDMLPEKWPPEGSIVDATALAERALEVFPEKITAGAAIAELGLDADELGSGSILPRAGVLYRGPSGWRIRTMNQRERWVWRIPMNLYACKPEDLQRIRGIGPTLAGRMHTFVQERGHLESLEDLDAVPGVGTVKLKALKKELVLY